MYVLEFKKSGVGGRVAKKNTRSYEDFEFLMREKEKLESKGNICLVYKISNNGKEITRLTDKNEYTILNKEDYLKEYRKGWKIYANIRDRLSKIGILDFYVENDILYIKDNNNVFEIEMVRKTPRYEIRFNNKLVADKETSQNDIIDKILNSKKNALIKKWVRKIEVFYN